MWLDFTDELSVSQQSLLISVQMKIKYFYFNEMYNNLDSLPKFLFERENSKLLNGIGNQIFERKIIDGEIITTHKQRGSRL